MSTVPGAVHYEAWRCLRNQGRFISVLFGQHNLFKMWLLIVSNIYVLTKRKLARPPETVPETFAHTFIEAARS